MYETPSRAPRLRDFATVRLQELQHEQRGSLEDCLRARVPVDCRYSFGLDTPFADQPTDAQATIESSYGIARAWSSVGGRYSKYGHENQDGYAILATKNMFYTAVLDGAGGSEDGSVASRIGLMESVTALLRRQSNVALDQEHFANLRTHEIEHDLIHRPTRSLQRLTRHRIKQTGKQSTGAHGAVAGVLRLDVETHVRTFIYALGDSRVIQLRAGSIVDRGTTWFMNRAGYNAAIAGDPGLYWKSRDDQFEMLSALGTDQTRGGLLDPKDIGAREIEAESGDAFLLFTDGLGDLITDYEIQLLARSSSLSNGAIDADALHLRLRQLAQLRNESTARGVNLHLSPQEICHFIVNPLTYHRGYPETYPCADNQALITVQIP